VEAALGRERPWAALRLGQGRVMRLAALAAWAAAVSSVMSVAAVVAAAVDEGRGRSGDAAQVSGVGVLGDPGRPGAAVEPGAELAGVGAGLGGVSEQVRRQQGVLAGQEQVVHLPERALPGGGLGGLRGELGVRVHVGERQVPPHVPTSPWPARSCRTTGSACPQ